MSNVKTDEQIKQDVTNQLTWDSRVDASDVIIAVEDGEVTISGTVSSYSASSAARDIASSVRGVTEVTNLLTVKFPTTFVKPTDEDIKNNVMSLLKWNFDVVASDLEVMVENGLVTLEGTVDSYWEKVSAESDAERASGVTDLVSKLAVVPTQKISDELLAERIMDRIEQNTVADIDQINLEVEDGQVILTGSVASWYVWSSVYDAAQYTAGVMDIEDQLKIEY